MNDRRALPAHDALAGGTTHAPQAWRAPFWCVLIACVVVLMAPAEPGIAAEDRAISARRAAERKVFTDAEIAHGFFRVAFGAEMGFGGRVDRIRKYARPVRVFVQNDAKPDRTAAVAGVIDDIRARVANLDIEIVERQADANFVVRLVHDKKLAATVRRLYGARGGQIVRSLEPQCLSGFRKDERYRITRSDVILVADKGDFIFYDCAYEELLQALGPIRDDPTVPWTMFNDNVQMGFFGVYDQYLLNILYHRRVRAGMTRAEVRALLPEIMPDVRAWVSRRNDLDPRPPEAQAEPRSRQRR